MVQTNSHTKTLICHYFPLTITKVLDFEALTDTLAQDSGWEAQRGNSWILLSEDDRKRSSTKAFPTGEEN